MVQRKAPQRLGTQAEVKWSHVKLERQSSLNHQQDTRSSSRGGGGDLKKKMKMKMERSIIAAELKGVVVNKLPKSPSPKNYMKPTSSSKERVKVPTIHSQRKNLNSSKPLKSPSRNSKGAVVNKATCSSTLKDSKFPKALELHRGGTEAEGISVTRVCPYTHCSLNGHFHEPLPPLKCFVSERRQLMKTQKGTKLKVKGVDTGQKAIGCCSSMDRVSEEFVGYGWGDEYPNESYSDSSSELPDEEMDFLEYVEFDEQVEEAKEDQNLDILPDNLSIDPITPNANDAVDESGDLDDSDDDDEEELSDEYAFDQASELKATEEDNETKHYDVPNIGIEEEVVNEVNDFEYDEDEEVECTKCPNDVQASVSEKVLNLEGGIDEKKLGMRVMRKKTTEDVEEMKGFNPRGPHFLSVEPDPDAEHVDLRHQSMDQRKSSEEWMVDYALRRKLSPAPKKKVAVLVEAFETVWKKPTSGFHHARIIQACN